MKEYLAEDCVMALAVHLCELRAGNHDLEYGVAQQTNIDHDHKIRRAHQHSGPVPHLEDQDSNKHKHY